MKLCKEYRELPNDTWILMWSRQFDEVTIGKTVIHSDRYDIGDELHVRITNYFQYYTTEQEGGDSKEFCYFTNREGNEIISNGDLIYVLDNDEILQYVVIHEL